MSIASSGHASLTGYGAGGTISSRLVKRKLYSEDSDADENPPFGFERVSSFASPENIATALVNDKESKKILGTFVSSQFSAAMQPSISVQKLDSSFTSPRSVYKRNLESVIETDESDSLEDKRRKLDVATIREQELTTLLKSFKNVRASLQKDIQKMEEKALIEEKEKKAKEEKEAAEKEAERLRQWNETKAKLRLENQERLKAEAQKLGVDLKDEELEIQTLLDSPTSTSKRPKKEPSEKKTTPRKTATPRKKPKPSPQSPSQEGAQLVRIGIQREFEEMGKVDTSSESIEAKVVKIECSFDDAARERDIQALKDLRIFLQNSQNRGEAAKLERKQMTQATTFDSTVPWNADMFFECVRAGINSAESAAELRERVAEFITQHAKYVKVCKILGPEACNICGQFDIVNICFLPIAGDFRRSVRRKEGQYPYVYRTFVRRRDSPRRGGCLHDMQNDRYVSIVGEVSSGSTVRKVRKKLLIPLCFSERKTTLISGSSQWFSGDEKLAYLGLPILVAPKMNFYNMKVGMKSYFICTSLSCVPEVHIIKPQLANDST